MGRINVGGKKPKGTATADKVLAGSTFSNEEGIDIQGTMVDIGSVGTVNITTEGSEYTIAQGYHNGLGKVKAVITGLLASVIKAGTTVGGIVGTFTSDATATAAQMLAGATAYVNGIKITGTMVNRAGTNSSLATSAVSTTVTMRPPAGYYDGVDDVVTTVDADFTAANIKTGINLYGLAGTFTADATSLASDILSGKTSYVNGVKITGTIPSKAAATITPSTVNQTIAAGQYLSGIQTIAGSANMVAGNIKSGVNIHGVVGTLSPVSFSTMLTGAIPNLSSPTFAVPANTKMVIAQPCDQYTGEIYETSLPLIISRDWSPQLYVHTASNYSYMLFSGNAVRIYNNNGGTSYYRLFIIGG